MWQAVNLPPNAPHERRGHPCLSLALYRSRVRSTRLLGGRVLALLCVSKNDINAWRSVVVSGSSCLSTGDVGHESRNTAAPTGRGPAFPAGLTESANNTYSTPTSRVATGHGLVLTYTVTVSDLESWPAFFQTFDTSRTAELNPNCEFAKAGAIETGVKFCTRPVSTSEAFENRTPNMHCS